MTSNHNIEQQIISNPSCSAFVLASAGTGKTKALIDRILRLLLNQSENILCITFTNIAVNEIKQRIYSILTKWSTTNPVKLYNILYNLTNQNINIETIIYAQNLYFKLLNDQNSLRICTIHAFCTDIIRKYALNLNINPTFEILDNIHEKYLISKILKIIYCNHTQTADYFISNFHENTIYEILCNICKDKIRFKTFFLKKNTSFDKEQDIKIKLLFQYNINDSKQNSIIDIFNKKFNVNINEWQWLVDTFLTKTGSKRKNISTTTIQNILKQTSINENLIINEVNQDIIINIQHQIYEYEYIYKQYQSTYYTYKLIELAKIFISEYDNYKINNNILDYNDLIYFADMLFKKDIITKTINIQHLLVDEAQDISKSQWQIIEHITNIIVNPDDERNSSIFIIGDEKQSIFRFQNADIESFHAVHNKLTEQFIKHNKKLHNFNLNTSFRSTQTILDIIYTSFQHIKHTYQNLFPAPISKMTSCRNMYKIHDTYIALWKLTKFSYNEQSFWSLPTDYKHIDSAQYMLATKIANFIITNVNNSSAKFEDFLILTRTRDNFINELIFILMQNNIPVIDQSKIVLQRDLLIMDIISVIKFILQPFNNLNLICLLKSPIININNTNLEYIIVNSKPFNNIWEYICASAHNLDLVAIIYDKLKYFIKLYQNLNIRNFFYALIDSSNLRQYAYNQKKTYILDHFIHLINDFAKNNGSIQDFIEWFESNTIEVTNDISNTDNQNVVKIMTIHSAKGLQAPIVILCGTVITPTIQLPFIWNEDDIVPIINNNSTIAQQTSLIEQEKILQEYMRLLYVAMTRAESCLIICGIDSPRSHEYCWYKLLESVIANLPNVQNNNGDLIYRPSNIQLKVNNYNTKTNIKTLEFKNTYHDFIDYNIQYPSLLEMRYMEYGSVFHKILCDAINSDITNLSRHPLINVLPTHMQHKIHNAIKLILKNTEFLELIKYQKYTEISVGLKKNNILKLYRIDLLIFYNDTLIIIDYKSDQNPQHNYIPILYIEQLHEYSRIIQTLYPNYKVKAKIFWLQNGCLSPDID